MLASITPLGERGRRRRWAVTVPAFLLGSALGGLVVGALAGALGDLLLDGVGATARLALLALAVAVGLGLDLLPGRTRAPGPRRQVDEDWLTEYREWVYGAGYGLQLGAAVLTQVATGAVWAMLAAAALTGSPAAGAAVGLGFGVVRALPLLATRRVQDAAGLAALHRRTAALAAPVRRATTLVLAGSLAGVVLAIGGT
ncbi:MAG TPA: hypothetical protein VNU66_04495 [Mycobacteriales bacterium]|nr:hypothetical protein [Mycobacteriales bacterium]